jgi:hypothetical protein
MEVNKYNRGKIYKIVSDNTNKIYIGSTCNELYKRLSGHKRDLISYNKGQRRYVTSFELLKYDDAQIILIENYSCKDKNELRARERYYYDLNKDIVCNKYKPIYHENEENDIAKKYREENKEYYRNKNAEFRNNNPGYSKEWEENNKESRKEQRRLYRAKNKDKLNLYRKEWRLKKKMETANAINHHSS